MPVKLEPGTLVFQAFTVQKELGSGGTASVYQVRDEANEDLKALKVTEINDWNRKSFNAEVHALKKLKHLSGIPLYLISFETPHYFGIVESLQGDTLHSLTENGGKHDISMKSVLCISYHLFDMIHIMQSQRILHRDIKSRNIAFKINHEGFMNPITILDFGLAREFVNEVDPLQSDSLFRDCRYVTPNMSEQNVTVQKDDAYMAIYMILELFDRNVFGTNTRASKASVMRKKLDFETSPKKYTNIRWIVKIAESLKSNLYEEPPNYAEIKMIIRKAITDFTPQLYKIKIEKNAQGKKYIV